MATLPIHLEVEDIAVGPVMIALQRMPGIIKMELKLGDAAPRPARQPGEPRGNNNQRIIAYLASQGGGPVTANQLMEALGLIKSSAHTALYNLTNDGVLKRVGRGLYELGTKAKRELVGAANGVNLLPPPHAAAAKNGHDIIKKVRSAKGDLKNELIELLKDGVSRGDLIKHLSETRGMNEKAVSSALKRLQNLKLAKSDGHGSWQLTSKGRQQIAAPAEAGV